MALPLFLRRVGTLDVDGDPVGPGDGASDGIPDADGARDGVSVGRVEAVGRALGRPVGPIENEGSAVGVSVGSIVGETVGHPVVGTSVGQYVVGCERKERVCAREKIGVVYVETSTMHFCTCEFVGTQCHSPVSKATTSDSKRVFSWVFPWVYLKDY